ncbi:MAG: tetratricopeptide repeat protein [Bacteroidetes bacterium]|nr:tetratricopeptide repeat protein [Bacteroidota bacterium]MCW5896671.1 tetratricopeptide repeat protein [Bacteroidota bacterium]
MPKSTAAIVFLSFTLAACGPPEPRLIPLFENLSHYNRNVTTKNEEAQKYFDQGFTLYYGFNHEAAILSFRQASILDSLCAMTWWGQAISAGPNINNPAMDSSAALAAWEALQKAKGVAVYASPVEQDLIFALAARYTWPPPDDRRPLDIEYANAMRRVWENYPDDPDVGALFADAMMNLRPWDLWTPAGTPQPGTPEIVATLERVLELQPNHPGACHFYIHTMEASPTPGKALPAADSLRHRVPGAGHLVHMPSHIDIRVGHYDEAVKANQRAIIADTAWIQRGGFYTFYRAHNFHFLAYAAMFEGRKELAMKAARDMVEQIPLEVVREYADYLDGFIAVPTHVMVRFGMWEEILSEPKPPDDLIATTAFWHYGRTVAFAASGRVPEATAELDAFKKVAAAVPESRLNGNNPVRTILQVGLRMAEGELEYRRKNYPKAFTLLRQAVQFDDSLRYDEPWGWMMPVRHSLGALLLEQGRIKEAEEVYRRDLERHPNNGWALKGLASCLHRSGKHEEAAAIDEKFKAAWARSDIPLKTSCFCSPGDAL